MRTVFGLDATEEQMVRVQQSLRDRELHFGGPARLGRRGGCARGKRAEAEEKLEKKVSEWVGHEVTPEDIEKLAE